jgi:hypothetical protein
VIPGGRPSPVPSFSHAAAEVALPASGDDVAIYGDQILRKRWAEERLASEGVSVNPRLPVIEGEATLGLRDPMEVADRALALAIVAAKGAGLPEPEVERILEERGAHDLFSPREQAFIDETEPADRDRVRFSWNYEASWTLLWALWQIEGPLGRPEAKCEVTRLVDTILDAPDLARHGLRSADEILNEADLAYRYHWAVQQARRNGEAPPTSIDPGVVIERHRALNWLTRHDDVDWDQVMTDI